MTIRLGFVQSAKSPIDWRGNNDHLPWPGTKDYVTNKSVEDWIDYPGRSRVAQEQLAAVQRFMFTLGLFFAHAEAKASGRRIVLIDPQYVLAEGKALRLGPEARGPAASPEYIQRPYPTLVVDPKKARKDRGGRKLSWAFERLVELASSSVIVDVWNTGRNRPARK